MRNEPADWSISWIGDNTTCEREKKILQYLLRIYNSQCVLEFEWFYKKKILKIKRLLLFFFFFISLPENFNQEIDVYDHTQGSDFHITRDFNVSNDANGRRFY